MSESDNNTELANMIALSNTIGSHIDLIQGGGGNTSVKIDDVMYIKASGTLLKDMSADRGYAQVRVSDAEILDESLGKPSMEWPMHLHLGKYVAHVHAVYVNVFTCMEGGKDFLLKHLHEYAPLYIPYYTPGAKLADAIQTGVQDYKNEYNHLPAVVLLENHGIIVSGDNSDEVVQTIMNINQSLQDYLQNTLSNYKNFSVDVETKQLPPQLALFPDAGVFASDQITANTITNGMKEIFAANQYIADTITALGKTVRSLTKQQVHELQNMEEEQYRINLSQRN